MCSLQSSFCSPTSIHGLGIKTRGPAPRVDCSVVTVRGLRAHRDNRRPDGGSSRLRRGPAGEPALTRLRYLRCADEQAPTRTERGILTDSARGQWAPAHLPATAQTGQTYATVSYVRPVCAVGLICLPRASRADPRCSVAMSHATLRYWPAQRRLGRHATPACDAGDWLRGSGEGFEHGSSQTQPHARRHGRSRSCAADARAARERRLGRHSHSSNAHIRECRGECRASAPARASWCARAA